MTDAHELTLGDIVLTGDEAFADPVHGYWFQVCAEGTNFGDPEAVTRIVQSLLADGDSIQYVRDGNRSVPIRVQVNGPSLNAIAHGEAALRRATKVRNELVWQPPDNMAAASMYDTLPSSMSREKDWDLDELRRVRTFSLNLTCSPFAASTTLTTVATLPEPPDTPTTITVSNADTVTGFSASATYQTSSGQVSTPIAPTDQGAFVRATVFGGKPILILAYTPASPVATSATPYFIVEMSGDVPSFFRINNAAVSPVLSRATTAGTTLYVLPTDGVAVTYIETGKAVTSTIRETTVTLNIHDISRTNMIPRVTGRQLTRVVEVGGTERTPASIHVFSGYDMADMQSVILHTSPEDSSGYSPPLRRWRTAGNAQTDAPGDTFSGKSEALKPNAPTFEVPNPALPMGGYVLAARLQASVATVVGINYAFHTFFPASGGYEEGIVTGTKAWTAKAPSQYEIVPLAVVTLPTIRGVGGKTRVAFACNAVDSDVFFDEAWLFRLDDDCALTIVENHPPDHIWIDSADTTSPVPVVTQGFAADRSDARHPGKGLQSWGSHVMHPDGTAFFYAGITNDIRAEATFRRRNLFNVAE